MIEKTNKTAIAVKGISKSFPGVQALKNVSFECKKGEIHALIGENGAGKSTLMKIIEGVFPADEGSIFMDGKPVFFRQPSDSLAHGITMVYQDSNLIEDLDVAQNIWLGREPGGRFIFNRKKMNHQAQQLVEKLGEKIDARSLVSELSVSEKQIVEIARALSFDSQILILDEPTSTLGASESQRLFDILDHLRRQGTSIIFISHRLPEVLSIADRITVLKDGEIVGTVSSSSTNSDEIVTMMVGRTLDTAFPPRAQSFGEKILEVKNLQSSSSFHNVNFSVRSGEILGIGGIQGNGQQEIVRSLFGLCSSEGTVTIDGAEADLSSPSKAIQSGVIYVAADRRKEGLFLPHSIRKNISVPHLSKWSHLGFVNRKAEKKSVLEQINALKIRTPSDEKSVGMLSGGNQQKVVFARWYLAKTRVYIFDEPTQGVDVATKLEIYRLIREMAAEGIAVIVLSSDVMELNGLCDRILVVAHGTVVDEVAGADATEERVIGSAVTAESDKTQLSETQVRQTNTLSKTSIFLKRYAPSLLLLALLLVIGGFTANKSPYFLTSRNFASLAILIAPLALAAFGQMLVITLGGIDLSMGPTISMTTAIASFTIIGESVFSIVTGVLICLAAGIVVGLLNGILIRVFKISDLVSTLATYSIIYGLALVIRPTPGGLINFDFLDFVEFRWGVVPVVFIITVLLYVGLEFLLLRGTIGTKLYATGSNEYVAFNLGIRVGWVRVGAYIFSGLTASLAGLVVAARIGSGDVQSGLPFTITSITAVVVGGASIFGGRSTAVGTFLGVTLVIFIQNSLNFLHVSAYWQYIWAGGLTLFAVAIYSLQTETPIKWQQQLKQINFLSSGKAQKS
ncbi:MAG: ATP-binding cassette domain-containing protein [SAR324 cluster bacterium]|nr:ATP-binding cassette domain-containing protein [SAR324 cluster bacterium]